jgi:hypothetical protein
MEVWDLIRDLAINAPASADVYAMVNGERKQVTEVRQDETTGYETTIIVED